MPTLRKLPLQVALSVSLLLLNPVAITVAHAQDAAAPSPTEREFWASTQKIDTDAAYQAYLARFPNGFFAPLAMAAIKKGADAPPAGSTQSKPRPVAGAPARPSAGAFDAAKIAGPTDSRAITQQTGDIFYGPGPITVGWLGAKKQVVVPAGRWVLLAAEDGLSGHATPIPLTGLVLAKIDAGGVRSLLLARFNSRSGNSRSVWTDAKACEDSPPTAPFAWHDSESGVVRCVTSSLRTPASAARLLASPIWKTGVQALATAGGTVPSGPALLTEMFYTGDLSNYLKVSRIDFGVSQTAAGPGGDAAAIDLSIAGRRKWAEAYSPLAAVGYRKKLDENELDAGVPPMTATARLPD